MGRWFFARYSLNRNRHRGDYEQAYADLLEEIATDPMHKQGNEWLICLSRAPNWGILPCEPGET